MGLFLFGALLAQEWCHDGFWFEQWTVCFGLVSEYECCWQVQLSDDFDSESCISWTFLWLWCVIIALGHWVRPSGIERAWRQLCDLQSTDRQAYRIFFEALGQSRSWRALCQPLHLDVELADLFLNYGDWAQVPRHRSMQACGDQMRQPKWCVLQLVTARL